MSIAVDYKFDISNVYRTWKLNFKVIIFLNVYKIRKLNFKAIVRVVKENITYEALMSSTTTLFIIKKDLIAFFFLRFLFAVKQKRTRMLKE